MKSFINLRPNHKSPNKLNNNYTIDIFPIEIPKVFGKIYDYQMLLVNFDSDLNLLIIY